MNPISFPCSHCSLSITVPPDASGRAVPCPHCKQATLVPAAIAQPIRPLKSRNGADGDQGPDFSETLRKAREATDSIFHDHDDEGDSLFGGNDTPRKLFVPALPGAAQTPTALADPSQPTLRVPGLSNLPPIPANASTPVATRALFVPAPLADGTANPFEDLVTETSLEGSSNMQPSGAMVEEEVEAEEVVRRPFPWKNLIIAALALYAIAATALAAWGWFRSPDPAKSSPLPSTGKR